MLNALGWYEHVSPMGLKILEATGLGTKKPEKGKPKEHVATGSS